MKFFNTDEKATQNEIDLVACKALVKNGRYCAFEGANIAGFLKVADAMYAQGVV